MAHSEEETDLEPKERLSLNKFPRPAKAKLIKVNMTSFFISPTSYQDAEAGDQRSAFFVPSALFVISTPESVNSGIPSPWYF
jgi:hypothetical protein